MSEWKVSLEKMEILPHPNADALEIGKLGTYQVVTQKGLYKDGDVVCFAPEKSILPDDLKANWENYLAGPNKNRVKSIRLRGEYSCGIIMPMDMIKFPAEIGEDISEKLGIIKYEAPIPAQLSGKVTHFNAPNIFGQHDCEHFRTYANELIPGERVVVTEKLHGSQFISTYCNTEYFITSKGLNKSSLSIMEDDSNSYWAAYKNDNIQEIHDIIREMYSVKDEPESGVRIFGEMLPCQKGFGYGLTKPTVKIFDIRVNGEFVPYDALRANPKINALMVPVLFDGPFVEADALMHCGGKETVSGKSLHIREGAVVSPYENRRAHDRTWLKLKVINPKFKDDESFN